MKIVIKIINDSKFREKLTIYGDYTEIFNGSSINPYINDMEENDDHLNNSERDVEILTDKYTLNLHVDDVDEFINMVENDESIICDLSIDNEDNKYIKQALSQKREAEKYTIDYIKSNPNENYKNLSNKTLSLLPLSLFESHPCLFNWSKISYLDLTFEFIESNKNRLDWEILSVNIEEKYYDDFYDYLILPELIKINLPINMTREFKINELLG